MSLNLRVWREEDNLWHITYIPQFSRLLCSTKYTFTHTHTHIKAPNIIWNIHICSNGTFGHYRFWIPGQNNKILCRAGADTNPSVVILSNTSLWHGVEMRENTSAPIGAWGNLTSRPFRKLWHIADRPTERQTTQPSRRTWGLQV